MGIDISDGGCEYAKEHIYFWEKKADGSTTEKPEQPVPFDEECISIKHGFSCKSNGRTPLAGTSYKLVAGGKDACYGGIGQRFVCVRGCTKRGVPKYLYPAPYEC